MLAASKQGTRYPFSFTGRGGEYFKIWIVNILLSIITLYIYSAWAKVRTRRYFAGNTVLDNSSFDYHATGKQILLGRIIAVVLLIIVTVGGVIDPFVSIGGFVILALLLPWAVWRSIKFNMRMTSYRNVRFGFDGKLGPMYMYLLVMPLIPLLVAAVVAGGLYMSGIVAVPELASIGAVGVFAMYLMYPWVHKRLANYMLRNYRYGTAKFSGELSTGRFYAIYIKAFVLSLMASFAILLVGGAIAFLVSFLLSSLGLVSADFFESFFEDPEQVGQAGSVLAILSVVFVYLLMFFIGTLVKSYFYSRVREHLFANGLIDQRVDPESTVTARGLWWVSISNILILVFTLGFGYPWTKVRMARYISDNSAVHAEDSLDNFVSDERDKVGALGEEFGDAFDMDIDVGF